MNHFVSEYLFFRYEGRSRTSKVHDVGELIHNEKQLCFFADMQTFGQSSIMERLD